MDIRAAKIILNEVPTLRTNNCNKSLGGAILINNIDVLKCLLDSGMSPTNEGRPSLPLVAAAQLRRFDAISLLLKHGANPYQKSSEGFSATEMAIMLESSSLLKALDRDKKYLAESERIAHELQPSSSSAFVGIWADLQEGFGSTLITLYPDGTGIFGSDVGGIPCIWKKSGGTTRLIMLNGGPNMWKPDEKQAVNLKVDGNNLVMMMDGEERRLKRFDANSAKAAGESSVVRRPQFIHVEKVCVSPGNQLYIQINGQFTKISMDKLVAAAQKTATGTEVLKERMVRWSEFQKGRLPQNILTNSIEVPFVNKHTDAYFFDKLAFDFDHVAAIQEGYDFTLFPYGSNNYYHGPDTDKFGEEVDGFALLTKQPFPHGKNWLILYFLKSKSYDRPQPSRW
jgi:hypothetical protein